MRRSVQPPRPVPQEARCNTPSIHRALTPGCLLPRHLRALSIISRRNPWSTAVSPPEQAALAIAPALAAATIEELRRHAPFDRMDPACLEWLVARLNVVYFAPDATVLDPADAAPPFLFIVRQGGVVGLNAGEGDSEIPRFRLAPGESFPLGALMAQRPVTSRYRAVGDTFCFRLSATDLPELLERSAPFRDFAARRLGSLLARSRSHSHADHALEIARRPFDRPVRELLTRAPVSCALGATVREALASMQRERVGSVLVTDEAGGVAGIFTLRDLRDRVALAEYPIDQPIDAVMTADPVTISADGMAFDAALVMARHGFHHVVIVEGHRAIGILAESDLFALQRVGLTALSAGIRTATTIERLRTVSSEVRRLSHRLLAQGVPAEQLTRIVATLDDRLTARVIEIEAQSAGIGLAEFCWLALGSEGRHEQTFATDQDNAIVFPDPPGDGFDAVRERLLPFAQRVNRALAACGFSLCKGEVMAGNPRWCLGESEWRRQFSGWMDQPDAQALLHSAIFFDFRAVGGVTEPGVRLREWLSSRTRSSDVFLRLMADNALRSEPPLGRLRDFALATHGGRPDTLDLKIQGAALFVDGARILSLAMGDDHTGTADRLRAVAQARRLEPTEVEGWVDAFHFIQSLRLTHQHSQIERGENADNYLAPDTLNALDRRILKEALRQARKLQERLRLDYRL